MKAKFDKLKFVGLRVAANLRGHFQNRMNKIHNKIYKTEPVNLVENLVNPVLSFSVSSVLSVVLIGASHENPNY